MSTPRSRSASVEDAEIVRLMVAGMPDGLRALLDEHHARVRSVLLGTFGERAAPAIDEALSDAAYRLWRSPEAFDPTKGTLRAYFLITARNSLIRILTAEMPHRHPALDSTFAAPTPAQHDTAEHASRRRVLRLVMDCLALLTERERHVILADLRAGDPVAGNALAEELGTTRNTVWVTRHRAMDKLRRLLAERGIDLGRER